MFIVCLSDVELVSYSLGILANSGDSHDVMLSRPLKKRPLSGETSEGAMLATRVPCSQSERQDLERLDLKRT